MGNGFFDYFLAGKQARQQEDAFAQQQRDSQEDRALRRQTMQQQQQQAQQQQRANVGQLVYKGAQAIANARPEQRPVFYAAIRAELSRHPDAAEWMAHLPEQYDPATVDPVVQQVMAQTGLYAQPEKDDTPSSIRELEILKSRPDLFQMDMQRRAALAQLGPQAAAMYRAPQQVNYGAPMPVQGPDGQPMLVRPGNDGSLVPVQGYSPAPTKATAPPRLPGNVVEKLSSQADIGTNLVDLAGGFQDGFAGNAITGSLENVVGRMGGERFGVTTEGQSDWWQQYDRQKNQVRNELFGSALTPSEQAAFEQADINPRMDPARIRANLKQQDEIIRRGLSRRAEVWKQQGYDPDAISAATSVPAFPGSQPPPAPRAPAGQPPIVRTQAEFDALPSGAVYVEADGQTYRKP